jgi:hypothetical protein
MKLSHLLGVLLVILWLQGLYAYAGPFDFAHDVGLAIIDDKGTACLAINNKEITPDTSITLVSINEEPTIHAVKADRRFSSPCPSALKAHMAGICYRLHVPSNLHLKTGPYFVVLSPVSQFKIRGKEVVAALEGIPELVSFRVCTSSEGLHFTLWQGKPLVGKRLWHCYFYLGYDVEPSCKPLDTKENP